MYRIRVESELVSIEQIENNSNSTTIDNPNSTFQANEFISRFIFSFDFLFLFFLHIYILKIILVKFSSEINPENYLDDELE